MGKSLEIGQKIINRGVSLNSPKHIFLMIFMLWDRKVNGPDSFYAPYYDILPPTLSNMPIMWAEEELELLQGSHLLEQIVDFDQDICEDYKTICRIVPEFRALATIEEFKWARMCVCSRNFGIYINGVRTSAMVPFADMVSRAIVAPSSRMEAGH